MLKKTIIFIGFVAITLLLSIKYNSLFYDQELFYLHSLPKGTLNLKTQHKLAENIEISSNSQHFSATFHNKKLFSIGDEGNNNVNETNENKFIELKSALLLISRDAQAQVNSFGDSFFKISDTVQYFCQKQIIEKIDKISSGIRLSGNFSDCEKSQYVIDLIEKPKGRIDVQTKINSSQYKRAILRFHHSTEQLYFGLGEQFSNLILGSDRPYSMVVRQKGVGRGDQPETSIINFLHNAGGNYYSSYCPMPIWYSSDHMAYMLNEDKNSQFSEYSYTAWMNNQLAIWLHSSNNKSPSFTVTVFVALQSSEKPFQQLISKIASLNGYTPAIPSWVNEGAILGLQGGSTQALQKYNKLLENGAVVKGLWLQDWVSKRWSKGYSRLWWNWELDHQHYVGWDQMAASLRDKGVNLLVYVNPMFVDPVSKKNKRQDLYKIAKDKGYFIKLNDGSLFETSAFSDFRASMIDFDNPEAKKFYQDLLRKIIKETGINGMMVDFSEAYPINGKHSSVQEAMRYHNRYPVKYHEAVKQVLDQFSNQEIYTFTRAGFSGTPRHTQSLWAGDQNMNFKRNTGLRSCLIAMLSSGLVGYSSTHCDIGGYTFFDNFGISLRTPQLMTRWMQLAAFSAVFRTHEGNAPEKTMQVYQNKQIAQQFAFYSQVFATLSEYRRKQWKICQKKQMPLIRPIFTEIIGANSSNTHQVFKIDDQYFLGEDILVSPMLNAKTKREYYLPHGTWIDIWTGEQVTISLDVQSLWKEYKGYLLPVFMRKSQHSEIVVQKLLQLQKKHANLFERYKEQFKENIFDL